jgi:hypothetical protein
MTSAYPIELDTLAKRVQARAIELGRFPSRNQVMSECKVGAPKATAALKALRESGFDPADPATAEIEVPTRRLHSVPDTESEPTATDSAPVVAPSVEVTTGVDPKPTPAVNTAEEGAEPVADNTMTPAADPVAGRGQRMRTWALVLMALPAFVAIWGGWVGLGKLTGFGPVQLLPGIADGFELNSAITLPIGVEVYAAFALRVWLSGGTTGKARRFAKWSAIGSLVLGMAGQVAYHLMTATGITKAPWQITTFVACLPVVVLGCGAALAHLLHDHEEAQR